MKVAITSSSRFNLYASTLLARLKQQGMPPAAVICTERSQLAQMRDYARRHGAAAVIRKVLEVYNVRGDAGSAIREKLGAYAEQWHLLGWNLPLPAACRRAGVKYISGAGINRREVIEFVREQNIDLLLNAGSEIFRRDIIAAPKQGILNAHMGFLPTFRGYNVLEWSLFHGDPVGVTLHFIDNGIDTGDILRFDPLPTRPGDSIEELRARSYPVKVDLMTWAVENLEIGCPRISQHTTAGRQYFAMHPRLLAIAESAARLGSRGSTKRN